MRIAHTPTLKQRLEKIGLGKFFDSTLRACSGNVQKAKADLPKLFWQDILSHTGDELPSGKTRVMIEQDIRTLLTSLEPSILEMITQNVPRTSAPKVALVKTNLDRVILERRLRK